MNDLVSTKTRKVLWMASNCNVLAGAARRMELSNDLLMAGLQLDRWGRCFGKTAPDNLIRSYKFYLSFENQIHCKDYITEKLFRNAYENHVVPVVFGATKSDYATIAPPGSYIFAEDYTIKQLVRYLHYLDRNLTAYSEYFAWRTLHIQDMHDYGRVKDFCHLCRILHGINIDNIYNPKYNELYRDIPHFGFPNRSRIVPSIRKWFYGTENRDCLPEY